MRRRPNRKDTCKLQYRICTDFPDKLSDFVRGNVCIDQQAVNTPSTQEILCTVDIVKFRDWTSAKYIQLPENPSEDLIFA